MAQACSGTVKHCTPVWMLWRDAGDAIMIVRYSERSSQMSGRTWDCRVQPLAPRLPRHGVGVIIRALL